MAETFVFDDKIQSTDGTLTLELTRSADLGIEDTPKPSVKLELTPSEDSWDRTTPKLELGATSVQAYGAAPQQKVELVTAPTLAEHMARVEAEEAAKAAKTAAVAAPVAAAAAVAQPAVYTQPATYAPAASQAAYTAPTYAQYGTQVAAAPAPAYTTAQNANAMSVATYPSAPQMQLYMFPEAIYPMTQKDRDYRMWAFILNIVTTCLCAWALLPLAWMIPTTVHSWKVYKGTAQNTTAFSVLDLIFTNLISGILLLCTDNK